MGPDVRLHDQVVYWGPWPHVRGRCDPEAHNGPAFLLPEHDADRECGMQAEHSELAEGRHSHPEGDVRLTTGTLTLQSPLKAGPAWACDSVTPLAINQVASTIS